MAKKQKTKAPKVKQFAEPKKEAVKKVLGVRTAGNDQFSRLTSNAIKQFGALYLNDGNPASFLHTGVAKRSSSSAMGIYYAQDSRLYDWCDEQVRKVPPLRTALNAVVRMTQQRPISVILDSEETDEALALRDFIEEQVQLHWQAITEFLIEGSHRHGFSPIEIIWDYDKKGRLYPSELIHTHPGFISFNSDRAPVYYTDKNEASVKSGDILPYGKFILTRQLAMYGNPYGESSIVNLEEPCMSYKAATYRILTLMDDYGTPFPIFELKNDGGDDSQVSLQVAACEAAINSMVTSSGLVVPPYADFRTEDRGFGKASLPHFDVRREASTEIIRAILGSTLGMMEAEHGSRAQADSHNDTTNLYTKPLARTICVDVQTQFVDPMIEFNWRGSVDDTPVIRIDIDLEGSESLDDVIKRIETAAKYDLGMEKKYARELLNVPMAEEGEDVITEPQPAPAQSAPFEEKPTAPTDPDPNSGEPVPEPEQEEESFGDQDSESIEAMDFENALQAERDGRELLFDLTPEIKDILAPSVRKAVSEAIGKATAKGKVPSVKLDSIPDDEIEGALAASRLLAFLVAGQIYEPKGEEFAEDERIDDAYEKFHRVVNMSPLEMKDWKDNDNSKQASIDSKRATIIDRVIRLLEKPKSEWTEADATGALKVYGFVSRMSKAEQGEKNKESGLSDRDVSLKNWGHNPAKGKFEEFEPVLFAEPGQFPGIFGRAARWLVSRKIVTPDQLDTALQSIRSIVGDNSNTLNKIEQDIRQQVLSLKKLTSEATTKRAQEWLSKSIAEGATVQSAIAEGRKLVESGQIEAVSDAYLETVARTESAQAMNAQKREIESSPAIRSVLLGWRYMNPADNRSRPSHAAMDSEFVEAGSPESKELGMPPYSYNCRCVLTPVNRTTGREAPQMSENLMEKINRIERFEEGSKSPCGCDGATLEYASDIPQGSKI